VLPSCRATLGLIATGVNDPLFPGASMKPPADMPEIEFHPIDSGHFALEDHCAEIGSLTRDFLGRRVMPVTYVHISYQSRDFGVASLNHVFHIGILPGAVHHGDVSFIEKGEYMPKLNWKLLTKKRGSSTQGLPPGKEDQVGADSSLPVASPRHRAASPLKL
jgi:hypothetical protein